MALGGGSWTAQNKILPGSYINFVAASRATSLLGERGFVAMPLVLSWGKEGEVFKVTAEDFQKNALKIFGYAYGSDELLGVREIFLNAKTLYAYRLGTSTKATCNYATAVCGGVRGNDLKIVITALTNGEVATGFNVKTMLDSSVVDSQDVIFAVGESSATTDKLKDNDFVVWAEGVELSAGTTPLSNGADATVTAEDYSEFLNKIEPFNFNVIGYAGEDASIKALFAAFTKRMRDERGVKFQCVLHKYEVADYEGVISVENNDTAELVYWTVGACAGVAVNSSNTNKLYNGELAVDVDYTQEQLTDAILAGKFIFHRVGDDVRVLEDVNTLVTTTDEKNEDFKANQTIRVLDQIGNDIATIFNTRFLGIIPNDKSGRISLWNEIVKHHQELQTVRAIENFKPEEVKVEAGDSKKSVVVYDVVTPTNCMSQLYMSCVIQ